MAKGNSNLASLLQNPRSLALKKFMFEVLQQDYANNEDLVERLSHHLVTEQDVKKFTSMVNKIYEMGYKRAIEEYKIQLSKIGINVKLG